MKSPSQRRALFPNSRRAPLEAAMTNRQPIPTDALLVAIDIAKVRNEVLIEAPNHKRRRRLSVLNTRAEHDRLIETLRAMASR